jgi:hypothetical protein
MRICHSSFTWFIFNLQRRKNIYSINTTMYSALCQWKGLWMQHLYLGFWLWCMYANPRLLWSHAASQLPHHAQCWPHPSPNPPLRPISLIAPYYSCTHMWHTIFIGKERWHQCTELFLVQYNYVVISGSYWMISSRELWVVGILELELMTHNHIISLSRNILQKMEDHLK